MLIDKVRDEILLVNLIFINLNKILWRPPSSFHTPVLVQTLHNPLLAWFFKMDKRKAEWTWLLSSIFMLYVYNLLGREVGNFTAFVGWFWPAWENSDCFSARNLAKRVPLPSLLFSNRDRCSEGLGVGGSGFSAHTDERNSFGLSIALRTDGSCMSVD